jgi:hypothetical protein
MLGFHKTSWVLVASLACGTSSHAQPVTWRVLVDQNRGIYPGLPDSVPRPFLDAVLARSGNDQFGMRFQLPYGIAGHWAWRQDSWMRFAANDSSGNAVLGPGRVGSEAADVFLEFGQASVVIAADGQRAFRARAGTSPSPASATWGVWRWDTARNVEIARGGNDGVLGPGLGSGWSYVIDTLTQPRHFMGEQGTVVLDSSLLGPANASERAVVIHAPGANPHACTVSNSSNPEHSPGVDPGDRFAGGFSPWSVAMTRGNRVLFSASTDKGRFGLWEVCQGAPRALMVSSEPGVRGPDIDVATAVFVSTAEGVRDGKDGATYFRAYFQRAIGQPSQYGLFWFDGQRHRPLVLGDDMGRFGPQIEGARWGDADLPFWSSPDDGEYVIVKAHVVLADGQHTNGYWRVRPGERPQPLILISVPGAFAPAPGQVWTNIIDAAPIAGGDVLVVASTDVDPIPALWHVSAGKPPSKILEVGQSVNVSMGPDFAPEPQAVTSFDTITEADDGTLMVVARLAYQQRAILTAKLPMDHVFRGGFDG